MYSPTSGTGTTFTDETGATYLFNGTFWDQISSGGLKVPSPQPAPQPKPVSSAPPSNSPPVDMKYYQGWNDQNAITADWAATWQQKTGQGSGGDGSSDLTNQIDQLYSSSNKVYDEYLNKQLPQELDTAMSTIDTQKAQGERQARSALDEAMQDFQKQQELTGQNQRASQNTLMRQRNAAVQQGLAVYGTGSNVGPAIFAIINQEFMRNSGNVNVAAQNSYSAIFSEQAKARRFYDDYLTKLQEDVKIATKQAQDEYNNRSLQIQMAKAQTEDAKTQAKLALLQTLRDQAQSIANWKLEQVLALETWSAQQRDTLENSSKYVQELATKLASNQLYAGYQDTLSSVPQQQNISNLINSPYVNRQTTNNDPWSQLTNPFV